MHCAKTTEPMAITNSPNAMPFFMPVRFSTAADGSASAKYDT